LPDAVTSWSFLGRQPPFPAAQSMRRVVVAAPAPEPLAWNGLLVGSGHANAIFCPPFGYCPMG